MRPLRWDSDAIDALVELMERDRRQGRRIFSAMRDFARTGRGDVKKLQGAGNEWRLRVGDWRVLFTDEGDAILVVRVDNRRDAY